MLITGCVALLSLLAASAAGRSPLLGISANPREGGTMADVVRGLQDLRKAGCTAMFLSHKWSDLERSPGSIDVKELANGVGGCSMLGYQTIITLQIIDTNNRTVPADLADEPFDSPEMRARLDALLRAVAPKLDANVRAVMLGNEVDAYLAAHPAELEPYASLVEHGRDLLRALRPGLRVGVTTMFGGLGGDRPIFRRVNRQMDVVTLTYYPLDAAFGVRPTGQVVGDFGKMVEAAAGKPLLLQEAGYPADPLLGSSEEKQAAFVDAVFDAMRQYSDKIEIVNLFLLHDFPSSMVDDLLKYYRLADPRFRAYLATLGLKRADGTPRKAWSRFLERARSLSPGTAP